MAVLLIISWPFNLKYLAEANCSFQQVKRKFGIHFGSKCRSMIIEHSKKWRISICVYFSQEFFNSLIFWFLPQKIGIPNSTKKVHSLVSLSQAIIVFFAIYKKYQFLKWKSIETSLMCKMLLLATKNTHFDPRS